MKKIYLMAAAAAMFAACSSDDIIVEQPVTQQVVDNAVTFDVYTQRANTRAGWAGTTWDASLDDNQLKKAAGPNASTQGGGFGVFAYYTNNNNYDQQAKPNFMYNECVTYKTSEDMWEYSPVKYWPNEYGTTAISDDADKVSFFAYAPYVEVDEAGKPTTAYSNVNPFGIQQLNRNTAAGDPIVKYQGTFATNMGVDLCWAVCNQTSWVNVQTGLNQGLAIGKPWIDVQRPAVPAVTPTSQKLQFTFKHATAKLNVQIDHFNDGYVANSTTPPTTELDSKTRIYVRSIKFTGFAMKGALNLNNTEAGANKPYWLDYTCNNELTSGEEITIFDGRKDGKEGVKDAIATNEKVLGLNVPLIQTEAAFTPSTPSAWQTNPTGVTNVPQNLFAKWTNNTWAAADNASDPIYVIPTDDAVTVEIVYDVETIDDNLNNYLSDGKTHGSTIQNRIRKDIYFGSINKFEAGKAYQILLHLGMNSVKFDAVVTAWDDMLPATDIDLPANMPQFAASTASHNADIPGSATTFTFAITGLTGGETVDITTNDLSSAYTVGSTAGSSDKHANPSGVAYVTISSITPYPDVINKTNTDAIKLTRSNGDEISITVKQLAEKLNLIVPTTSITAGTEYTLSSNTTTNWEVNSSSVVAPAPDDHYIKVWHNGAELTDSDDAAPAEGQFKFEDGTLTLGKATVVNDVIKVTIKTGDVPEETKSFKVDTPAAP